ncbi:hypothetical protein NKH18_51420 [Streptomyces sp. M10(2022)]
MSSLDTEGITQVAEGLEVHVPSVKGRPPRDVAVAYGEYPDTCPVRCWLAWKEAAGLTTGRPSCPSTRRAASAPRGWERTAAAWPSPGPPSARAWT